LAFGNLSTTPPRFVYQDKPASSCRAFPYTIAGDYPAAETQAEGILGEICGAGFGLGWFRVFPFRFGIQSDHGLVMR